MRDWRVVKLTGWTFDQIDDAPGARLDWLLQVEDTYRKATEEKQRNG